MATASKFKDLCMELYLLHGERGFDCHTVNKFTKLMSLDLIEWE